MRKHTPKLLKLAAAVAFVSVSTASYADGMKVLVTPEDGGSSTWVEASDIAKITFADGNVCFDSEPQYFWAMKNVRSIKFLVDTSGIGNIQDDSSVLLVNREGNILNFTGHAAGNLSVAQIFSTSGAMVYNRTWDGEAIDITNLAAGVYILKINETTFKFIR